jgi:hypothetical protein
LKPIAENCVRYHDGPVDIIWSERRERACEGGDVPAWKARVL